MATIAIAPELQTLKSRLKQTWMAGDYHRMARYMDHNTRDFYERLNVAPGSRLLDVACGSGELALLAARDGVEAVGVDLAPHQVETARVQAQARGLNARFEVADAENLPFEDASFDVVVSMIGAMFAPRPDLVAKELLRVCCPGGTIAMANWTPQGFVGQMFKVISSHIAPSGMPSPVLWGDEATVRARIGHGVSELSLRPRYYTFDFPFPPAQVVDFFATYYGPTNQLFASLSRDAYRNLHAELEALWFSHNRASHALTVVEAEYLEVIAIRA